MTILEKRVDCSENTPRNIQNSCFNQEYDRFFLQEGKLARYIGGRPAGAIAMCHQACQVQLCSLATAKESGTAGETQYIIVP